MIKLDLNSVMEVEKKNNIMCVSLIRKQSTAMYQRIINSDAEQKYFTVKTQKGEEVKVLFISTEDYNKLNWIKIPKRKRGFKGRPYTFCKNCAIVNGCHPDIFCEKREEEKKKKAEIALRQGDDRFWKNGKPKRCETLCQSGRYLYAHTGAKRGECQKEKCRFYENKGCIIELDK